MAEPEDNVELSQSLRDRMDQAIEDDRSRPSTPVSPAPPPSAGAGGAALPEEETSGLSPSLRDRMDQSIEDDKAGLGREEGYNKIQNYVGITYEEAGIKLPDSMSADLGGKDALVPMIDVEREPNTSWREWWESKGYSGKQAIDIVKMRNQLAEARNTTWIRQKTRAGEVPTQEEVDEKMYQQVQEANAEVYALAERQRGAQESAMPGGRLWLDTDQQGKLYASRGGWGFLGAKVDLSTVKDRGLFSHLFAPFIVNMAGIDGTLIAEDVDEEGKPTGLPPAKMPYNEAHMLGWLDWLGRESLLTYASTAAVAGGAETPLGLVNPANYWRGWGSNEQLELLSRGEDIVSLRDELQLRYLNMATPIVAGLEAAGIISEETAKTGYAATEFGAGFGLALADPDIFSLLTAGLGKAARLKELGALGDILKISTRAKSQRYGKQTLTAAQKMADLARGPHIDDMQTKVGEILSDLTYEQRVVALNAAREILSSDPKASKITEAVRVKLKGSNLQYNRNFTPEREVIKKHTLYGKVPQATASKQDYMGRVLRPDDLAEIASRVGRERTPELKAARKKEKKLLKRGKKVKAQRVDQTIAEYKIVQLQDMFATMALSDALTAKKASVQLRSMTRAARGVSKVPIADLNNRLQQAADDVQKSREALIKAFEQTASPKGKGKGSHPVTKDYADAKKVHDDAISRFNSAALELSMQKADDSERFLDTIIAHAQKRKKQSEKALKKKRKEIKASKAFKINPKNHDALVKGILRNAPDTLNQRALVSALAVALREQGAAYGKLADFIGEVRPAGRMKGAIRAYQEAYPAAQGAAFHIPGSPAGTITPMAGAAGEDISIGIKGLNTAEEAGEKIKELKTAKKVVEFIAANAEDASYREIAKRIAVNIPEDLPVYIIDTATDPKQIRDIVEKTDARSVIHIMGTHVNRATGRQIVARGVMHSIHDKLGKIETPKAIIIRGANTADGRNAETLLHELLHVATTDRLYEAARPKGGKEYTAIFKQLNDINNRIVAELNPKLDAGTATAQERHWARAIVANKDEIVAWGFTNPEFRAFLKTLDMPGEVNQSAWSKFVATMTRILGLDVLTPTKAGKIGREERTALSNLIEAVDELIDLPLPVRATAYEIFTDIPKVPPTPTVEGVTYTPRLAIAQKDAERFKLEGHSLPELFQKDEFFLKGWDTTTPIVIGLSKLDELSKGKLDESKLQQARDFIASGKPMMPPLVTVTKAGKIEIEDGRHRIAALRELGKTRILVDRARTGGPTGTITPLAAAAPSPAAARHADDLYLIEQVELLTGWTAKGAPKNFLARMLVALQSEVLNMWDPANRILGPASKELHQIGVATLGQMKHVLADLNNVLVPAAESAGKKARRAAEAAGKTPEEVERAVTEAGYQVVLKYITSFDSIEGKPRGSVMNTFFSDTQKTLWDVAKPMLAATWKGKGGETDALGVLSKMWKPSGHPRDEAKDAALVQGARRSLEYGVETIGGKLFPRKSVKGKPAADIAAYRQEGANLSFEDFSEAMRNLTKSLNFAGAGAADSNRVRVLSFAAKAVAQMALLNHASTRVSKLVSDLPPDALNAAVRVASGDSMKPGQDFVEATKALNRLKIPGRLLELGKRANKKIEIGLRLYSDEATGHKVIIPRTWMEETSKALQLVEKSAEEHSSIATDFLTRMLVKTWQGVYRLWHTAILTGLMVPRTAYWTNIYIGNFSQLFSEQGAIVAGEYAARSLADIVGWAPMSMAKQTPLGKYVDHALERMDLTMPPGHKLASITNAILNRNISQILDPSLATNGRKVIGKSGKFTMGELRRWAVEQNIFTSFVASTGLANQMLSKNAGLPDKVWEQITSGGPLARKYKEFADTLEQRQRVGLFTDLIVNKGKTPEEAGEIVRDALYDWSYPMTELEQAVANNLFMFYNFTRRAMGQAMRILLDPFVKGAEDSATDVFLKSSPVLAPLAGKTPYKMANVMALEKTRRELHEWYTDEDTATEYPWWAKKASYKMFAPNSPIGKDRAANYTQVLGDKVSHKVLTMPSFTPVEMVNQWGKMFRLLGAWGLAWAESAEHIVTGSPRQRSLVWRPAAEVVDLVLAQSGPVGEGAVAGVAKEWGLSDDIPSFLTGGKNVRRLSDRKLIEAFDLAMSPFFGRETFVWEDTKNPGMMRTIPSLLAALKTMPGLANEFNAIAGPYLDVTAEGGDVKEATIETILSLLNLKTYRYDPEGVRDYDVATIKRKLSPIRREEERKGSWLDRERPPKREVE